MWPKSKFKIGLLAAGLHKCPIVLVHGTHDVLIPIEDSEALLTLAKKAELIRIEGAAHGNIHEFPAYLRGLETRLKQVGAALS